MSASSQFESPRGTDAQIFKEREITASAIQGAMAFGYQGGEYPPDDAAWLRPFYDIGKADREKDDALGLLTGLHTCITIDGPPMEVAERIFEQVIAERREHERDRQQSFDNMQSAYRLINQAKKQGFIP